MRFKYLDAEDPPIKIIYPADFEQWIYDTIPTNLMYDRFKKKAQCVRCGNKWDMDIDEKYYANELTICPYCQKEEIARPHTSKWSNWASYFWMWNDNGGINFAVAEAWWRYEKEPIGEYITEVSVSVSYLGRVSPEECFDAVLYNRYCGYRWMKQNTMGIPGVFFQSRFCEHSSTRSVIEESYLKHCMIKANAGSGLIKEMEFFTKHPAAEYIRKAGLDQLINDTIWKCPTYIRPNWKAKSVPGILRLSHQDVDKLKAWDMFKVDDIAAYHMIRKFKRKPTKEDLQLIRQSEFYLRDLNAYAKRGIPPHKFIKYIHKQFDAERNRREQEKRSRPESPMCHAGYYYQPPGVEYSVKREYEDYLDLIEKLGYPRDSYYLFPKDLKSAHDAAAAEHAAQMAKEAAEKNKKWNEEFERTVLKELENYAYEDGKYIIRPLRSKEEFINEGINNHNCVASYAERAKAGKTKIFVLRRTETPNLSYVTIELAPDYESVKQCYETGNRIPPVEIDRWVKKWLRNVVQKSQKKAVEKAAPKAAANEGRNQILCPAM